MAIRTHSLSNGGRQNIYSALLHLNVYTGGGLRYLEKIAHFIVLLIQFRGEEEASPRLYFSVHYPMYVNNGPHS